MTLKTSYEKHGREVMTLTEINEDITKELWIFLEQKTILNSVFFCFFFKNIVLLSKNSFNVPKFLGWKYSLS